MFQSEQFYLASLGYEVFLYGWGDDELEDGNVIICRESASACDRHLNKFIFASQKRKHFREALRRISPDVIHVHLVSKYPLAVYPELKGYKVIQTLHGPNLFCATSWGCIKRNSAPCSMGIGFKCYRNHCVSFPSMMLYSLLNVRIKRYLRDYVSCWHCPSRNIYNTAFNLGYKNLVYIPLGIDECYSQKKDYSNNIKEKNVLFVGAVSKVKGLDYLFEAFKLVKRNVPDARLIIAGGGDYLSEFSARVEREVPDGSVEVLGRVPHEKIAQVYKRATVFAMPSIWQEQFGLVGPEALAMGIPVVGSNIGGIPEWLHHNEWGYLVPPRDTRSLADRITTLLNNPDLSYRMGQRGRQFVINEYSYLQYVHRIELLIRTLYRGEDYMDNF